MRARLWAWAATGRSERVAFGMGTVPCATSEAMAAMRPPTTSSTSKGRSSAWPRAATKGPATSARWIPCSPRWFPGRRRATSAKRQNSPPPKMAPRFFRLPNSDFVPLTRDLAEPGCQLIAAHRGLESRPRSLHLSRVLRRSHRWPRAAVTVFGLLLGCSSGSDSSNDFATGASASGSSTGERSSSGDGTTTTGGISGQESGAGSGGSGGSASESNATGTGEQPEAMAGGSCSMPRAIALPWALPDLDTRDAQDVTRGRQRQLRVGAERNHRPYRDPATGHLRHRVRALPRRSVRGPRGGQRIGSGRDSS